MQRQRLFGALFLIVVIFGLFLFLRESDGEKEIKLTEAEESEVEEIAAELSSRLGITVAQDVERILLADVREEGVSGLATRDYTEGKFIHTVLAALPDPDEGTSYQAWLVRGNEGDEDYSVLLTGKLRQSKGGYLLDYSSGSDLSDHNRVWVTIEKEDDGQPEIIALEGEF